MNNRTKQLNEIMTNITVDFAVEGMYTLTKFIDELQGIVSSYGQQLRIVGFTTRKPTARPNIYFKLGVDAKADETEPNEVETVTETGDDSLIGQTQTSEEEENQEIKGDSDD